MNGLVMRSTGSWYDVLSEAGETIQCRIRGKLRLEGIKETNPIAVGDQVAFDLENGEGIIHEILPRKNYIIRQSVKKTGHIHVIAANIDQAIVMATLILPRTSSGFIDRFLVSAESFRIPQVIIFNKKDLLDDKTLLEQRELVSMYQTIGVRCLEISSLEENQEEVKALLQGKTSLLAGHSGVGKSTLLNKLSPSIEQKTSSISGYHEKGTHTTTFAEMFQLNEATRIIDTPGIKEFGLQDMSAEELSDYFPEMRDVRLNCKFGSSCVHVNEPKCAVLDAVKSGAIASTRYSSYLNILTGKDNRK
ncbi:MAG TPA: ribosome small subunit-dependent GTPase A [Cyclobacteriaceae bacterium]|nr:ribosome small subunit-dependent GTPase A [Cyclobacteriaceae bacterium]